MRRIARQPSLEFHTGNQRWREAGAAFTWPVLSGDDARWAVRAAIDAVVAQAYGLTSGTDSMPSPPVSGYDEELQ